MRNTPSILILNANCILWLNKILPPVLTLSTDNKRHLDFSLSKEPDGWTYLYGTIAIQICGCKKDKRRKKSMRKDFCWLYWQIHCFFIHFKLSPKTVPENRIYLWYYWPTTCDWQVISNQAAISQSNVPLVIMFDFERPRWQQKKTFEAMGDVTVAPSVI